METKLEWQEGVRFEALSGSGHTVILDGAPESGGTNAGARPMELVLIGTAGCAAYDVVTILEKSRQPVSGCVAHVKAQRAEEPPRVFTHIDMHFVVRGDGLTESKVARAVELSAQKYCSASIMMKRAGVEVTHSFEIVEEEAS